MRTFLIVLKIKGKIQVEEVRGINMIQLVAACHRTNTYCRVIKLGR